MEPTYRHIMRDGILLPGMVMPALAPPPEDPHPNKKVQKLREAWDMRIIDWDAVWRVGPKKKALSGFAMRQWQPAKRGKAA